jgi:hypothetical protein
MGLVIGPSKSHSSYVPPVDFATASLGASACGGRLYCKSGGVAWIVAPAATGVAMQWAGGQYNGVLVGNKCCVSEWSALSTALTNAGLTPSQWFVPNQTQLPSAWACKSYWDSYIDTYHWTSKETTANVASRDGYGGSGNAYKSANYRVRAIRCVTY